MTTKPEALARMSPLMQEMLSFGSNVSSSLESLYLKRGKDVRRSERSLASRLIALVKPARFERQSAGPYEALRWRAEGTNSLSMEEQS